jgi:hypothetical protein
MAVHTGLALQLCNVRTWRGRCCLRSAALIRAAISMHGRPEQASVAQRKPAAVHSTDAHGQAAAG